MFDLFKKASHSIVNSFTQEQKATIVCLTMMICSVDTVSNDFDDDFSSFSPEEERYVNTLSNALGVGVRDLEPIADYSVDKHLDVIRYFNAKQKEWFAITIYEAMSIDGPTNKSEIAIGVSILKGMGIDVPMHKEIIGRLWDINNIAGHLEW